MDEIYTLAAPARSELLLRKSRFIGCVEPVDGRDEARRVIDALRAAHPQATHVCWALLAGGQSAANDDGEPGGTAGRPMLEVLRHHHLDGVLATVVRYFGGVKLGAGGLVRAYADTVAQALAVAHKQPRIAQQQLSCRLPYALEGLLRRELELAGAKLESVEHGNEVLARFRLPVTQVQALRHRLDDAGAGRLQWACDDEAPTPGRE